MKNLTLPSCFLHRINSGLWFRVAETSGSATYSISRPTLSASSFMESVWKRNISSSCVQYALKSPRFIAGVVCYNFVFYKETNGRLQQMQ